MECSIPKSKTIISCTAVPSMHASVGEVAQSFASQYEDVLAKGKIIEFNNSCSRRLNVLKDANFSSIVNFQSIFVPARGEQLACAWPS